MIDISEPEKKALFRARLHAGEVEAVILAQEISSDLIIMDDNTAKKTAKFLGFRVTGTLGVLVKSKEEGLIQEVKPYMMQLIENNLYVDQNTRRLALKIAKE